MPLILPLWTLRRSATKLWRASDRAAWHRRLKPHADARMLNWLNFPKAVDRVQPDDFDVLEEIHAASFPLGWAADEQASLNEAPGVTTFVVRRASATASRRPLGFITVRIAADEAEVLTLAVHPRQRRNGLARLLLGAALRHLYAERVTQVFLEVDPSNDAALGLYKKHGFVAVGDRPAYYDNAGGERLPALTMALDIEQPASILAQRQQERS